MTLRLDVKPNKALPPLTPGARYLLTPRFTDFNSDRVIAGLGELNAESDPFFLKLIKTPLLANEPVDSPDAVRAAASALAQRHGMTASQLAAFGGVLGSRLHLVWGLPGTGKTHFLAVALLCLAETHRQAGRPLRAVLTGFTHTSIDNCLSKEDELQTTRRVVAGAFPVAKLGQAVGDVPGVAPKEVAGWLTGRSV